VFAASGVSAQETGWYGAVDLGYHWPQSIGTQSNQTSPDGEYVHWAWKTEKDWTGFVRLGYQFNPHVRAEVEGGYRPGDLKGVRGPAVRSPIGLCTPGVTRTVAAPACGAPSGSIDAWTLMANVIYDFAPDAWLNPFVGVGVGINRLDVKALGQYSNIPGAITAANPSVQTLTADDDDIAIAYQALAGASIKATDKLKIDFTYRWATAQEHTWQTTSSGPVQPGAFKGQYKDQSLTVGLRYSFASPPPPAAAPAAAASPAASASAASPAAAASAGAAV
jgi:OOP family OmpA-OmpF porin